MKSQKELNLNELELSKDIIRILVLIKSENPIVTVALLKFNSVDSRNAIVEIPLNNELIAIILDYYGSKFESEFVNIFSVETEMNNSRKVFISRILIAYLGRNPNLEITLVKKWVQKLKLELYQNINDDVNNFYIGIAIKLFTKDFDDVSVELNNKEVELILYNFSYLKYRRLIGKNLKQFKGVEEKIVKILYNYWILNKNKEIELYSIKDKRFCLLTIKKIIEQLQFNNNYISSEIQLIDHKIKEELNSHPNNFIDNVFHDEVEFLILSGE